MMDSVKCPLCGTMNPPTNKVCLKCQTPLSGQAFQPGQAPVRKDTGELEPILPEWLREVRETAKQSGLSERYQKPEPSQPASSGADLLAGLQSQAKSDDEEEVPDWLASITGAPPPKQKQEEPEEISGVRWVETGHRDDFQQEDEVPSWLTGMQSQQTDESEKDELTDWFRDSGADKASGMEPPQQVSAFDLPIPAPEETPDWLKQMAAEAEAHAEKPEPSAQNPDSPDWLKNLGATPGGEPAPFVESTPAESEPSASGAELPSWLAPPEPKKSDSTPIWLKEQNEAKEETPPWLSFDGQGTFDQAQAETGTPPASDAYGDLPDWLKSAAPESSIFDEPAEAADVSREEPPVPPVKSTFESTPAFSDDALPGLNSDSLFTEMPDWLSSAVEPPPSGAASEPVTGSDALAPDILPSWVEAMRPVEQSLPGIPSSTDQTMESKGALAGLQGVLPAGSGFTPTSKPKVYSNKLNVSEEQLKHAGIFEQILAAETAPEILVTEKTLAASRGLRWALAGILAGLTLITSLLHTQFFSAPIGVPNELGYAVAVAQAVPENAPVLVAVDYEPSRAGEMEAAAAPLFDNLMLLKHPRLTFISSNESGSVLAERFISGPLAGHNYQGGVTYLNLGYLSGGQVGIRAFAQNPSLAAPMDIFSQAAWSLPPLQGVTALNQFALVILLTDDADAARSWVEQTQAARGAVPFIVVSSAQAAPMIQPYYDSGQLTGMVSGLYGGAIIERQYNNGRPGTARNYWDAYSLGMLFAMLVTLGGGFVNLGLGLRERAASRGGK